MRETDEAMIKVLMTGVSNIGKAGVATIAFRLGQAMDSEKISLGYLAQRGISDVKYIDLIEDGGGRVHIMPPVKGNKLVKLIKTIQWVSLTAKENTYDIVHINADTAYLAAIYMKIFQSNGMTKMIVHSHSTMVDENNKVLRSIKIFLHCLCKRYIRKNAHLKLACSSMAAKWMFDKDQVTVVPNGIDCKQFEFDSVKRDEYRKEMKLGGKFVICCVGRLAYPKNSFFTIDIFREILKEERNSILLFIGDGELRGEIERYIESNGLGKKVLLLGNREDISGLLSASDVFLLPSRFEGLGIVYIEAQASGMPVFASDKVPQEAFITDSMFRNSLNDSAELWAQAILQHKNDVRKSQEEMVKIKKYDIYSAAKLLQSKYIWLMEKDDRR